MSNQLWRIETYNSQIADTGDYDGHYELTNGDISLITKDDLDDFHEEDSYTKLLVETLNQLGAKWEDWKLSEVQYELHLEKENCRKWKEMEGSSRKEIL